MASWGSKQCFSKDGPPQVPICKTVTGPQGDKHKNSHLQSNFMSAEIWVHKFVLLFPISLLFPFSLLSDKGTGMEGSRGMKQNLGFLQLV